MPKQVQLELKQDAKKKHSVLFKPANDAEKPAVTGLYLMNTAFKELGEPESIAITIAEA